MSTPLSVQTLGQLALWRDGERLPETIWKRGKARNLFLYFITHPTQFIARERITSDLWPTLDDARAERDFKVALTALHTALQPERAARQQSPYVVSQGNSYGLSGTAVSTDPIQASINLDYLQFETQIIKASRLETADPTTAINLYQQALPLFQGEYLPEAVYEDWTVATRERMTTLFLTGAMRLAHLLNEQKQPVEVAYWCERVLAVDACWEDAYRLLMQSYAVQGNRPFIHKTFNQCRQNLERELSLEPMPETVRLYEQMVGER